MKNLINLFSLAAATALWCGAGCATSTPRKTQFKTLGSIKSQDPRFFTLVAQDSRIEVLGEGFNWSEGPVWLRTARTLVFSDVPSNTVYQWKPGVDGARVFLRPSGYTGSPQRGGESGSNGLTVDSQGRLVLCQHGDRRVARLENDGTFTTLAGSYQGKRFNSPNDLAFKSNGDLYFTDPPYGLEKGMDDPRKELSFQGVYRVTPDGTVTLLTSDITFPNGIAFSPDERTLYVAVSDPKRPVIMAYDVQADGTIARGRVFFDASPLASAGLKGLPDGLKVDRRGNLFATGPGGVLVIAPDGTHLGTILTGEATANCAWGDDGSTLYITADAFLCRLKTLTKGNIP